MHSHIFLMMQKAFNMLSLCANERDNKRQLTMQNDIFCIPLCRVNHDDSMAKCWTENSKRQKIFLARNFLLEIGKWRTNHHILTLERKVNLIIPSVPLNSMALLFDKSAESIARETQNFLYKKDLIQSTKKFPFPTFLHRRKERKTFLMLNVKEFVLFHLLTRSNEWKFNDSEFDFLGRPKACVCNIRFSKPWKAEKPRKVYEPLS